jgi:hypothetical protein
LPASAIPVIRCPRALFRADVELAVGCLGDQWKDAYGETGFLGQFIVTVALWLADGIRLIVNGLEAAIDTGIYWRSYRIAVAQATNEAAIVYFPCCGLGANQNPRSNLAADYRPRTAGFDATGSHILQNATWQVWNATEAIAVGTAEINSCQPACAGGRYVKAPVTITLSNPIRCRGFWFWSKATWHFPDSIPPGETQDRTENLVYGC